MSELAPLLQDAFNNGHLVVGTDQTYTVSAPIVINVTKNSQGPIGIDLGGARIVSNITNGAPVIQINVAPGVDLANLTLSNFSIWGSGSDGDGVKIVADGADRLVHDWTIRDITIQHVGGAGLDLVGNFSSGTVFNSWMHGNADGGARFDNGTGGGAISDVEWAGGGFRKNDVGGLILDHGAHGVSVDGAYFVDNFAPGIVAPSGITSVTTSGFENNVGSAIEFNGQGDFWANTFSTFGPQATGIDGSLTGSASLVSNINEYYGSGGGSILAYIQGAGHLAEVGGGISTGGNVSVDGAGTFSGQIVSSKFDFQMPSVAPVTAADSAPVADSHSGSELETALRDALTTGYIANLASKTYVVTEPIVINIDASNPYPKGIDLGGATIVSQITDGRPVIQINVASNTDVRYLTLSNFTLQGNGHEGDGIKIVTDSPTSWLYNWTVSDVTVKGVGGYGLDIIGSVFEGMVANSWMIGNADGGARFAHSANDGQASALRWYGGGVQDNGTAGITLANGARDLVVDGAVISNNHGPGILAPYGITAVTDSRIQDNQGVGVVFQNYGSFINNEFVTSGSQLTGVEAWLNGPSALINNTSTYTGAGTDPTALANLQGYGQIGVYGNEKVIAGPSTQVVGLEGLITPHAHGFVPSDSPLPGNGGVVTPGQPGGGTDTPVTGTPGTETPGTGTPGTDTPGTGTPGTDTPVTGTPGTDTPGTDLPGNGGLPGTDTPVTGTPGTDTPGTGNPGTTPTGDHITLGPNDDVLHHTLAELNGDTISGFGHANTIDITGSLIGRDSLVVTKVGDGVSLSAGDSSFHLSGNFSGGDFMAVARGSGADAHTLVTFENYLPNLQEGVGVAPAAVNGVTNQPYLTGDGSVGFSVELKEAVAEYHNMLGTYKIGADGTISDVHIVFSDTKVTAPGTTADLGIPGNNEKIGFFLIQNGHNAYGDLPDDLSFRAPGTDTPANVASSQLPVLHSASLGDLNSATVFHSFSTLNPGSEQHVLSGTAPGGHELLMGFDDQQLAASDKDYQDVLISIKTNKDGMLIV